MAVIFLDFFVAWGESARTGMYGAVEVPYEPLEQTKLRVAVPASLESNEYRALAFLGMGVYLAHSIYH